MNGSDSILIERTNVNVSTLSAFLFKLLLFVSVFDAVRSLMVLDIKSYLTIFKELSTFSLLILLIFKKGLRISRSEIITGNLIFVTYLLTFGSVIILINDFDPSVFASFYNPFVPAGFVIHFKTIESFLVILVLLNYEYLTGKEMKVLLDYFATLCVIYVFVTLAAYFVVDLSWIFEAHWEQRISIGYPTADTQILCFGLAYLMFKQNEFSKYKKMTYGIILVIGILMNSTGTGFLSLSFLMFFSIFTQIRVRSKIELSTIRMVLFSIVLGLAVWVMIFNTLSQDRIEIKKFSEFFQKKISSVSNQILELLPFGNPSEMEEDYSVYVRRRQVETVFSVKDDIFSMLFGGPVSLGTQVENQNVFLLRSYGIVGIAFYYFWIIQLLLLAVKNLKSEDGKLLLAALAIMMFSNLSTITSYMFGVAVSFALLISYCRVKIFLKHNYKGSTHT